MKDCKHQYEWLTDSQLNSYRCVLCGSDKTIEKLLEHIRDTLIDMS